MTHPKTTGHIALVGAGPGARDLLTLRALERIRAADVLLYDRLVDPEIMELARPEAERIYVGKDVGACKWPQGRIDRLIVAKARLGLRVVRLKSGDSGLFGRLEEELLALREAGIGYEIIPGVPSAVAAAAACGIPLTRRLTARRVQFVTGHGATGALPEDIDLASLADAGASTVVFMGKRTFPKLAEMLFARGLPPETPALLAEAVSTPEQQLHRTTMAALAERLQAGFADAPALILYGPLAEIGVGFDD